MKSGVFGLPGAALGVHRVEQAVSRELRMKGEPDESALQPVVDGKRKRRGDVRIDLRLVVGVDQVEEAARIVGEAAAVRKIAHVADARPAGRRHVLIGGTHPARIGKAHEVLDLDLQSAFHDRRRNRVARDLRCDRPQGADRQQENDDELHPFRIRTSLRT